MNSKFWVLSSLLLFTFGCAHSTDVAKTDIPEDDMVASAPIIDRPAVQQKSSRMPASVDENADSSCQKHGKKQNCK
jgi:hypothetical protein